MNFISEFLKIPKSRIGALIGKGGETKKALEKELSCRIDVAETGEVDFSAKDSLVEFKLKTIIKAIGRGFTCDESMVLLDDDFVLEVVNLKDYSNKSEKKMMRFKSRIIGADGKSRKLIEELTDTKVVVFGKTVSVVGKFDDVEVVKEAIFMLIGGATHRSVRTFLERRLREKIDV